MIRRITLLCCAIFFGLQLGVGVLVPATSYAAGLIPEPTGKCPEDYKLNPDGTARKVTPLNQSCTEGERDYALADIKSLLVRIGNFLIGISGAVALLVFTVGGFLWIASAGSAKQVEKGRAMMIGGAIGLAIMFSAYTIIAFGLKQFAGSEAQQYLPKTTDPNVGTGAAAASYAIGKPALNVPAAQTCGKIAGASCVASGKCTGAAVIAGACSASQDCCLTTVQGAQTTLCGKVGGACQDNSQACTGPYVKGMCPGVASVQCCIPVK